MKKLLSLISLIAVQLPAIAQTTYGVGAGLLGGPGCSFFGVDAGNNNTSSATYNTFIGHRSGFNNTTGNKNTFTGLLSGGMNSTGGQNTFIGYYSGYTNQTSSNNTFVGESSGYWNTGNANTFIGTVAGINNSTGGNNSFLGISSGLYNTTGSSNTFVGAAAGGNNATGNYNTTLGNNASCNNNGSYATGIGAASIVSANYTLAMGYAAKASQADAIAIGANANASAANATAIGSGAIANQANTVIIGNNANVGIGTSAPENSEGWERAVDIHGTGHAKLLVSTTTGSIYSGLWSHSAGYFGAPAGGMSGTWSNHPFSIITNKLARMTLDVNGNVGIGTTTPAEKLTVSTAANNNGIRIRQTGSGFAGIRLDNQTAGGRDWGLLSLGNGNTQGAGNFLIYNYGSSTSAFLIEGATNNVGIGTTAPQAKLHIASNSNVMALYAKYTDPTAYSFASMIDVAGDDVRGIAIMKSGVQKFIVDGKGDVWATGNYYSSDRRLKKDFKEIDEPLKKLAQLKGYEYYWNDLARKELGFSDTKQIGLIAQDVEKVIPQAVKEFNKEGYKAVDYARLIPLLVEGINQQQQQIAEKDSKLEEMEQRLVTMQSALDDMKQSIAQCCAQTMTTKSVDVTDQPVLEQNTPNPFSSSTQIKYRLPAKMKDARILILDANGRQIKSIQLQDGQGSVTINGSELMPGMYLYSLIANGKEIDTKRMILTD